MAGLRKLNGLYYARIRIPRKGLPRKEKLIGLNTPYKLTAERRLVEIKLVESQIKAGQEFILPWRNKRGEIEKKQYTITTGKTDYLKARKGDGLRQTTLDIYERAINDLIKVTDNKLPTADINSDHIDSFKRRLMATTLTPESINIRLRSVKTFLLWLRDRRRIESIPKIKLQNAGEKLPIYLSDKQFNDLLIVTSGLSLNDPTEADYLRRIFHFYRETGCRLSEPFNGEIDGLFLSIPPELSKTHQTHYVELTPELVSIVEEMQQRMKAKCKYRTSKENHIKRHSRLFQSVCKLAGIKGRKFHSLRHTAAIRLWIITGDIYKVSRQLGHSSVITTEIYTKFDPKRLKQDFPTLVKNTAGDMVKSSKSTEWGYKQGDARIQAIA